MHIRKYDFDYGRRALMEKAVKGIGTTGVLTSMWPMLAKGENLDISRAYPEELLSIEAQTKGKIKAGDVVDANNVEHVAHLLDPIALHEIKNDQREVHIVEPNTEITAFYEEPYLEATLANRDHAILDENNNIWYDQVGTPWKGGTPFVNVNKGVQGMYNITLAWGRHNWSQYAIGSYAVGREGDVQYNYHWIWSELQVTSRADGKIFHNRDDLVRYQSVFFTHPGASAGISFLSTWYRDQRKFPEFVGYLPAFKRVREYPANQRFEPLVPGAVFFLTDAWAAGDPLLTWGEWKILERKPMLGVSGVTENWYGSRDNWEPPYQGGGQGRTYRKTYMAMIPEVVLVRSHPVKYPRSPYGYKDVYLDARNFMYTTACDYDRKGQLYKSFETGSGKFQNNGAVHKTLGGDTVWSWLYVHCHDVQSGRMSLINHNYEFDGYISGYDSKDESQEYNKFLTAQAMRRLGA